MNKFLLVSIVLASLAQNSFAAKGVGGNLVVPKTDPSTNSHLKKNPIYETEQKCEGIPSCVWSTLQSMCYCSYN